MWRNTPRLRFLPRLPAPTAVFVLHGRQPEQGLGHGILGFGAASAVAKTPPFSLRTAGVETARVAPAAASTGTAPPRIALGIAAALAYLHFAQVPTAQLRLVIRLLRTGFPRLFPGWIVVERDN